MSLLTDPLLRVQTVAGQRSMNLPEIMSALGRDEVLCLTGIQRHQEDAFHVFLCHLAGAILARRGDNDPTQDENYWRSGLRSLAGDAGDDAWTLVVDDPSRPAFMQPPLPKDDHSKLKRAAQTPDALDLLPTAKNHDVKQSRAARRSLPDEWIYALVSVQTMSGYFGCGKYGISRMNGGFGNRPIVELVRRMTPGGRWSDAVVRLLDHRRQVLAGELGYDPQGLVLVWLPVWDGKHDLPLTALDPCYIEVCRRIRLKGNGHHIEYAEAAPSDSNRIAAGGLNGVVGDAWLPIDLGKEGTSKKPAESKALPVSSQGLTVGLLRRLVFGDMLQMTCLHRPLPEWEGAVWLSVSVLVRGEGKTDGFHSRRIQIPARNRTRLFGLQEQRDSLAALSRSAIEYAGKMRDRVLRPSVFVYLEGGPEKKLSERKSAQAWWVCFGGRFESLWSDDYFPWLWSVPDPFDEQATLTAWLLRLRDHALRVLHEAGQIMPDHAGRKHRARARAERMFWRALYSTKNFPFLKEQDHERAAND